jgi:hypothetical protein
MQTLDFLRRILPSSGFYASCVVNAGDGARHGFTTDIERLADAVVQLSQRGNNTYYAVASFIDKTKGRRQANVHSIKSLFLDVDCGPEKPFADWKAGLQALATFVSAAQLPKPMIVRSGNGLHVYWVLDRELTGDEWRPLGFALKAAAAAHNFDVDMSVPSDSARVLRPIGTVNPRGGGKVTLLLDAPPVTVEQMEAVLGTYGAAPKVHKPRNSGLLDALAVRHEFPPAKRDVIVAKCAQVKWAVTQQKDVAEPMWYALMGVAAYCEDPEGTAVEWSKDHPGFSADATIRKLEQWRAAATGPATCARFESERPAGCKGCRFSGHIGSPARLGIETAVAPVAADAPDTTIIPLPRPYKRTAAGIKIEMSEVEVDVCNFDIYPLSYGRDETLGYEVVRFRWKRPHVGWQTLTFRQALLSDGHREFPIAIADQGVVLAHKKQTEVFQTMLRAYMDELRNLRTMTNLYSTMGWKDGNSQFLLGDTLYRATDTGVEHEEVALASGMTRLVDPMFVQAGTLDEWAQFTALLEKAKLYPQMFALCVSMSAPLYAFTGLRGLTINLYGPTGSGKTLAQFWQQSVWGDPTKLHYTAKFTPNALYARMGLYNNLPVTIDEATMLAPKEIGDFLYSVSQGREKARLLRNAEERDTRTWATVVTTSSNKSLGAMLLSTGMESDAQMARLLEITVYPHPLFTRSTDAGRRIYEFLSTRYGTAGPALIEHFLSLGESGLRAALDEHKKRFLQQHGALFTGNERYWEQSIFLADFAGYTAQQLGLIQFDYTEGIRFVMNQIGVMRQTIAESQTDAFDLIAEYLNDNASAAVTVMHTGASRIMPDHQRMPRGELRIRFDVYRPAENLPFDRGVVLLDRRHFRTWMATRGADYKSAIRELTESGANATPSSEKAYLGKNTPIKVGQQYVIGVNLTHPRMIGVLTDVENAVTASSLVVLSGGKP